jgi:hypothetical protein
MPVLAVFKTKWYTLKKCHVLCSEPTWSRHTLCIIPDSRSLRCSRLHLVENYACKATFTAAGRRTVGLPSRIAIGPHS